MPKVFRPFRQVRHRTAPFSLQRLGNFGQHFFDAFAVGLGLLAHMGALDAAVDFLLGVVRHRLAAIAVFAPRFQPGRMGGEGSAQMGNGNVQRRQSRVRHASWTCEDSQRPTVLQAAAIGLRSLAVTTKFFVPRHLKSAGWQDEH